MSLRVRQLLNLVMIEHTLFALPMALIGAVLASRGLPNLWVLLLVALAFTGARTAAMGFNRLVDRRLDAANPRTAGRHLPSGQVTPGQAIGLISLAAVVYFLSAWLLNPLCFKLSPFVLALLLAYSYTKRFTWLCHLFLGICLGLAPVAGWLAVTGAWAWAPIVLGLGVVFWVAGFDTIYALQDVEFDRNRGLYSLPASLGRERAFRLSAFSHVLALALFVLTGILSGLGWPYYPLCLVVAGLLYWEHRLVDTDNLERIDFAFFKVNSAVSGVLLLAVIVGLI